MDEGLILTGKEVMEFDMMVVTGKVMSVTLKMRVYLSGDRDGKEEGET